MTDTTTPARSSTRHLDRTGQRAARVREWGPFSRPRPLPGGRDPGLEGAGERSAASHLARSTGSSVGQAKETLETAEKLKDLPVLDAAARAGELSAEQTAAIADVGAVCGTGDDEASEPGSKPGSPGRAKVIARVDLLAFLRVPGRRRDL